MQFRRHPLASAVALSVLLSPLAAQQDWVEWDSASGTTPGEQYGFAMTGLGDWDMDGFDDYIVTSPGASANALNAGTVTVHSGQDGSVLTTLDGMAVSDQLGFAVASLGEHGDGLPKVAIGAPFQSSINGAFTGLVRVYAWDDLAGSAFLLQEIAGPMPGAMFGLAVAAADLDGDGDLDLGVGAPGANALDGQVLGYLMSGAGAAEPAAFVWDGAAGSAESFGWSIDRALDLSGIPGAASLDGLVAGAPFATDLAAGDGAVAVLDTLGGVTTLPNPLAGTADAHLGYSVAGGEDAVGGGLSDVVAGAPDSLAGDVVVWSGDTLGVSLVLNGSAAGEEYGYAVTMMPDANFDGRGDIAIGAPGALNDRGRFEAQSLVPSPSILFSASGPAGTDGRYGFSLGVLGDINQTTKSEVAVGAPARDGLRGAATIYAPPAQDLGPISLVTAGEYEWETTVNLLATNLAPGGGGNLYWYVGTQQVDTVSIEGYNLNIGGNLQLIAIDVNPGTQAQQSFFIPDAIADGTPLLFQMVEDRNGFVRTSNVDGNNVIDPGVSLFVIGDQAGAPIRFQTKWGIPNSPVYYYATTVGVSAQANQPAPNGGWTLNLRNARYVGQPGDKSDLAGDSLSNPLNVPPGFAGTTAFFQTYDWDLFEPALTNVVEVTFQ